MGEARTKSFATREDTADMAMKEMIGGRIVMRSIRVEDC